MHLVIGQIGIEKNAFELRRVISGIEQDGLGVGLKGCKAWLAEKLEPLSWAIAFSCPRPADIWDLESSLPRETLEIVKRIASELGHGKYYFRGIDDEIESLWDMSHESILHSQDVFGGLPLSITIGTTNVIEIYEDWCSEFIKLHYSDFITPFESDIGYDDKYRLTLYAKMNLLAVKGNWLFKLSTRKSQTANMLGSQNSVLRQSAN